MPSLAPIAQRPLDSSLSDEQLVACARAGQTEALDLLLNRFRPRLMAALARRVRDRDTCEDLAQQAILDAWRHLDRYDPQWRFATWVFTIAFRRAASWHRQAHRRRWQRLLQWSSEVRRTQTTPAEGPLHQVMADELRGNLWQVAHQSLPEGEYTVLWLRFGESLDATEIGQITGRSPGHVRVIQHRALRRLRQALGPEVMDESLGGLR